VVVDGGGQVARDVDHVIEHPEHHAVVARRTRAAATIVAMARPR
jgi:hypothetical protein